MLTNKEHELPSNQSDIFDDVSKVFKLIRLYRANECLWNPSSSGYHNNALKESAWTRIVELLDNAFPVDQIKLQIKSLHSYYKTECKAFDKANNKNDFVPLHPYYYELNFMKFSQDSISNEPSAFTSDNPSENKDHLNNGKEVSLTDPKDMQCHSFAEFNSPVKNNLDEVLNYKLTDIMTSSCTNTLKEMDIAMPVAKSVSDYQICSHTKNCSGVDLIGIKYAHYQHNLEENNHLKSNKAELGDWLKPLISTQTYVPLHGTKEKVETSNNKMTGITTSIKDNPIAKWEITHDSCTEKIRINKNEKSEYISFEEKASTAKSTKKDAHYKIREEYHPEDEKLFCKALKRGSAGQGQCLFGCCHGYNLYYRNCGYQLCGTCPYMPNATCMREPLQNYGPTISLASDSVSKLRKSKTKIPKQTQKTNRTKRTVEGMAVEVNCQQLRPQNADIGNDKKSFCGQKTQLKGYGGIVTNQQQKGNRQSNNLNGNCDINCGALRGEFCTCLPKSDTNRNTTQNQRKLSSRSCNIKNRKKSQQDFCSCCPGEIRKPARRQSYTRHKSNDKVTSNLRKTEQARRLLVNKNQTTKNKRPLRKTQATGRKASCQQCKINDECSKKFAQDRLAQQRSHQNGYDENESISKYVRGNIKRERTQQDSTPKYETSQSHQRTRNQKVFDEDDICPEDVNYYEDGPNFSQIAPSQVSSRQRTEKVDKYCKCIQEYKDAQSDKQTTRNRNAKDLSDYPRADNCAAGCGFGEDCPYFPGNCKSTQSRQTSQSQKSLTPYDNSGSEVCADDCGYGEDCPNFTPIAANKVSTQNQTISKHSGSERNRQEVQQGNKICICVPEHSKAQPSVQISRSQKATDSDNYSEAEVLAPDDYTGHDICADDCGYGDDCPNVRDYSEAQQFPQKFRSQKRLDVDDNTEADMCFVDCGYGEDCPNFSSKTANHHLTKSQHGKEQTSRQISRNQKASDPGNYSVADICADDCGYGEDCPDFAFIKENQVSTQSQPTSKNGDSARSRQQIQEGNKSFRVSVSEYGEAQPLNQKALDSAEGYSENSQSKQHSRNQKVLAPDDYSEPDICADDCGYGEDRPKYFAKSANQVSVQSQQTSTNYESYKSMEVNEEYTRYSVSVPEYGEIQPSSQSSRGNRTMNADDHSRADICADDCGYGEHCPYFSSTAANQVSTASQPTTKIDGSMRSSHQTQQSSSEYGEAQLSRQITRNQKASDTGYYSVVDICADDCDYGENCSNFPGYSEVQPLKQKTNQKHIDIDDIGADICDVDCGYGEDCPNFSPIIANQVSIQSQPTLKIRGGMKSKQQIQEGNKFCTCVPEYGETQPSREIYFNQTATSSCNYSGADVCSDDCGYSENCPNFPGYSEAPPSKQTFRSQKTSESDSNTRTDNCADHCGYGEHCPNFQGYSETLSSGQRSQNHKTEESENFSRGNVCCEGCPHFSARSSYQASAHIQPSSNNYVSRKYKQSIKQDEKICICVQENQEAQPSRHSSRSQRGLNPGDHSKAYICADNCGYGEVCPNFANQSKAHPSRDRFRNQRLLHSDDYSGAHICAGDCGREEDCPHFSVKAAKQESKQSQSSSKYSDSIKNRPKSHPNAKYCICILEYDKDQPSGKRIQGVQKLGVNYTEADICADDCGYGEDCPDFSIKAGNQKHTINSTPKQSSKNRNFGRAKTDSRSRNSNDCSAGDRYYKECKYCLDMFEPRQAQNGVTKQKNNQNGSQYPQEETSCECSSLEGEDFGTDDDGICDFDYEADCSELISKYEDTSCDCMDYKSVTTSSLKSCNTDTNYSCDCSKSTISQGQKISSKKDVTQSQAGKAEFNMILQNEMFIKMKAKEQMRMGERQVNKLKQSKEKDVCKTSSSNNNRSVEYDYSIEDGMKVISVRNKNNGKVVHHCNVEDIKPYLVLPAKSKAVFDLCDCESDVLIKVLPNGKNDISPKEMEKFEESSWKQDNQQHLYANRSCSCNIENFYDETESVQCEDSIEDKEERDSESEKQLNLESEQQIEETNVKRKMPQVRQNDRCDKSCSRRRYPSEYQPVVKPNPFRNNNSPQQNQNRKTANVKPKENSKNESDMADNPDDSIEDTTLINDWLPIDICEHCQAKLRRARGATRQTDQNRNIVLTKSQQEEICICKNLTMNNNNSNTGSSKYCTCAYALPHSSRDKKPNNMRSYENRTKECSTSTYSKEMGKQPMTNTHQNHSQLSSDEEKKTAKTYKVQPNKTKKINTKQVQNNVYSKKKLSQTNMTSNEFELSDKENEDCICEYCFADPSQDTKSLLLKPKRKNSMNNCNCDPAKECEECDFTEDLTNTKPNTARVAPKEKSFESRNESIEFMCDHSICENGTTNPNNNIMSNTSKNNRSQHKKRTNDCDCDPAIECEDCICDNRSTNSKPDRMSLISKEKPSQPKIRTIDCDCDPAIECEDCICDNRSTNIKYDTTGISSKNNRSQPKKRMKDCDCDPTIVCEECICENGFTTPMNGKISKISKDQRSQHKKRTKDCDCDLAIECDDCICEDGSTNPNYGMTSKTSKGKRSEPKKRTDDCDCDPTIPCDDCICENGFTNTMNDEMSKISKDKRSQPKKRTNDCDCDPAIECEDCICEEGSINPNYEMISVRSKGERSEHKMRTDDCDCDPAIECEDCICDDRSTNLKHDMMGISSKNKRSQRKKRTNDCDCDPAIVCEECICENGFTSSMNDKMSKISKDKRSQPKKRTNDCDCDPAIECEDCICENGTPYSKNDSISITSKGKRLQPKKRTNDCDCDPAIKCEDCICDNRSTYSKPDRMSLTSKEKPSQPKIRTIDCDCDPAIECEDCICDNRSTNIKYDTTGISSKNNRSQPKKRMKDCDCDPTIVCEECICENGFTTPMNGKISKISKDQRSQHKKRTKDCDCDLAIECDDCICEDGSTNPNYGMTSKTSKGKRSEPKKRTDDCDCDPTILCDDCICENGFTNTMNDKMSKISKDKRSQPKKRTNDCDCDLAIECDDCICEDGSTNPNYGMTSKTSKGKRSEPKKRTDDCDCDPTILCDDCICENGFTNTMNDKMSKISKDKRSQPKKRTNDCDCDPAIECEDCICEEGSINPNYEMISVRSKGERSEHKVRTDDCDCDPAIECEDCICDDRSTNLKHDMMGISSKNKRSLRKKRMKDCDCDPTIVCEECICENGFTNSMNDKISKISKDQRSQPKKRTNDCDCDPAIECEDCICEEGSTNPNYGMMSTTSKGKRSEPKKRSDDCDCDPTILCDDCICENGFTNTMNDKMSKISKDKRSQPKKRTNDCDCDLAIECEDCIWEEGSTNPNYGMMSTTSKGQRSEHKKRTDDCDCDLAIKCEDCICDNRSTNQKHDMMGISSKNKRKKRTIECDCAPTVVCDDCVCESGFTNTMNDKMSKIPKDKRSQPKKRTNVCDCDPPMECEEYISDNRSTNIKSDARSGTSKAKHSQPKIKTIDRDSAIDCEECICENGSTNPKNNIMAITSKDERAQHKKGTKDCDCDTAIQCEDCICENGTQSMNVT